MKAIKNVCLFVFLIFGIIMQSEIFQDELWNFSTSYFQASRYEVENENMKSFLKDVSDAASEYGVKIFAHYNEMNNKHYTTLHIYGDDGVIRQTIKDIANVEETVYTSLISGITKVEYHEFQELDTTEVGYECFLSYIGNEEAIDSVYNQLSEKYSLTYPEYWNSTEQDMIIIVWGMIIILMIIMNVIRTIRQRKEVVVRISFGESVGNIISKAIIGDVIIDIVLFLIAKLLLSCFVSGAYENRLVMLIYTIGVVLSVLPFFLFSVFDIRKAFANITEKKDVVYLLYGLKLVACIATIFTISTNISSIQGNLFADENLLKAYKAANYFTVQSSELDFDKEKEFWDILYEKEYSTLNPVICMNVLKDKNDVIFVNENGKKMLQGFEEQVQAFCEMDNDVIIFIPKGNAYEENKKLADERLSFCFDYSDFELQQLKVQYIEYSQTEYFSYLDTSTEDGMERTKNPVIIYQVNNNTRINGGNLENYKGGAILFRCDEYRIGEICKKYEDILGSYKLVVTNVQEQYLYNHAFFVKFLGFLSSLCGVVLLLDIMIILAVIRLEFRQNAMRISLMKILGYSLFERHKMLLLVVMIENIVVLIGMLIYSLMSVKISIWVCISISALISIIEFMIIILNIIHVEKSSVQKALKGGCL